MDKNITILLAEDDSLLRDLYEQAFRLVGYHIEIAIDGQDAVDKLDHMSQLPGLILLDMMMPRMSGFDVLRYLKHSEKYKDIQVIILSNVAEQEAIDNALKLGASNYLIKTDYVPSEIVAKVGEMMVKK